SPESILCKLRRMAARLSFFGLRLIVYLGVALVCACDDTAAGAQGNGGASSQSDAAMSPDASQCTTADCYQCDDLGEAACGPDNLCFANQGQRLDTTLNCFQRQFGGCTPNLPCGGALTTAIDAEGTCWMFPSTCLPTGFTYTDSQDPECGYAHFDGIDECPAP
ncbi:MAG TPA: hypothetical protein VHO25_16610, partial [Polyangiaceae bacterium]|nr:hypothetical protein [Polyangiaceae bacterium]